MRLTQLAAAFVTFFSFAACANAAPVSVKLDRYDRACGIEVAVNDAGTIRALWPAGDEQWMLDIDTTGGPAIKLLEATVKGKAAKTICQSVSPVFVITTGSRRQVPDRFIFFDKPASRATERSIGALKPTSAEVRSDGRRVDIALGELSAGPFKGQLIFRLFAGSPLIQVEAAMTSEKPASAYIYDLLLEGKFDRFAGKGLDDKFDRRTPAGDYAPIAVRNRVLFAESDAGSLAVFPPPHSFFFPRDRTDNLKFVQAGAKGFGLRQDPAGGGAFVPWFDMPPGKTQRMSAFLLPSTAPTEAAHERVLRYTHGDKFVPLPGRVTFTSHYHSRLTVAEQAGKPAAAEFVKVMKDMGVQIVHLAEFHGDGHPDDTGDVRLKELKGMFDLCRKYSDEQILLIPGEEGNKYMAHPWPPVKPIHPGHWMYLFPKPVYLTFKKAEGQPFVEEKPGYGKVYHVGSQEEMVKVFELEKGLCWTTHPRIKASFATPDAFKDQPWYQADLWLGAAWKSMPGDLSDDRLGKRCLDLLDDMNNWGQRKFLPGEVDVFEIDRTHELYGHMNINYLKLDRIPKIDDWSPVLGKLKSPDYFVTTGEVLIREWKIEKGKETTAEVEWTFPPGFAELIVGDGKNVRRHRLSLASEGEFGRKQLAWPAEALRDAKWARIEVWDVAMNGAFTQPAWVER